MINSSQTEEPNQWLNLRPSDFGENSPDPSEQHSQAMLTFINKQKGMLK